MDDEKALIDLANAHATQQTFSDGSKSDWSVEANKTNEVLVKLSKAFTDPQVFEILEFAREYELIALNAGIQFQKKLSNEYWEDREEKLKNIMDELVAENERLAGLLENLIGEEV